jgi:hypothetical protein
MKKLYRLILIFHLLARSLSRLPWRCLILVMQFLVQNILKDLAGKGLELHILAPVDYVMPSITIGSPGIASGYFCFLPL